MKRFFNWLTINTLFAAVFVAAWVLDSEGLAVLGAALTFILLGLTIFMFLLLLARNSIEEFVGSEKFKNDMSKIVEKNGNRPLWLRILDPSYDVALLLFLAINNFYVSTVLYTFVVILQIFCLALCRDILKKEQENEAP